MKIFKPFALVAMLSGCVAGEYNSPSHMRVMSQDAANRPYQFTTSTEVARVGETSQRFEIRHGDCGSWDCNNDRRRIEVNEYGYDTEAKVGETRWYGWSVYLPANFQAIEPSNTHIGQGKLLSGSPLWMFNLREGRLIFEHNIGAVDEPQWCHTLAISQMRGRWTDIVVYADYSLDNEDNRPIVQTWINGRLACSSSRPMVSNEIVSDAGHNRITFRYGIYNSFVSRWLNNNRTQAVISTGFVDSNGDGRGRSRSIAQRPFDIDWGVQLPTQVVFYDEVRIGRSREDVDVRMRHMP